MNKVQYISLKEICTVNQGLQIPISKRCKQPGENRYFYITIQFLKKEIEDDTFYIENPPKTTICNEDDILVVRTGSTGQVLTGIVGCFHNNFFKVNFDREKIFARYLFYCLSMPQKQKEMKKRAGITVIPDLNHFMFLDMKIPIFSLKDQINIANILFVLDKKIELNNRINAELESMAKILYDYWFVQFDFPNEEGKPYKSSGGKMVYNSTLKREIPLGWNGVKLSDIASITMGQSPDGASYNESCDGVIFFQGATDFNWRFPSIRQYTTKPNRIAKKGDILLSVRAPVGDINIADNDCCIGRGLAALNSRDKFDSFLFYVMKYFKTVFDRRNSEGTTFGSITKDDLYSLLLAYPPKSLLTKYENIVSQYNKLILAKSLENKRLIELRDWLLPMLMNGQVTVK
ncbi:restriction endonuclease subunit S [Gilliamella sp. B14448G11]|uniref:restriction endonuclease subunit S n=1 Tax=unclassified Gilliamella TaxID=2685620 RepID=UPI0018DCFEFE|nr:MULTISPECIES: restriction endonuclease subunit S [unclassified Gilliamella]MBI0028402.1 restriction endonuclease subunit S [Gilliamella sp. B14448G7]MBI0036121.1 restriction endonuclease subunit S [Gilliamella sp. B14448G11]MBI0042855.1 restriction endonuclease subunit S [Gilliamella sp. B14448G12]